MLGIKLLWSFPKVRMAMRNIGTPQDRGVRRDDIPTNLIVLYCSSHQQPSCWIESQRFLYNRTCIAQLREIFHSRNTPGQDLLKLGEQTLFDFRVLSKQIPSPCQGMS